MIGLALLLITCVCGQIEIKSEKIELSIGGPWPYVNLTADVIKVGNSVTIGLPQVSLTSTSESYIVSSEPNKFLPRRLAPKRDYSYALTVRNIQLVIGKLTVTREGLIYVYCNATGGLFRPEAQVGFESTAITYFVL
jgi:hypothetical protein